ncbi:unnamed protein product [Symbiodinium natans]|uniref:C3H1-type domain-containing protein n=1 Tax=Symbiodinium natans TaxID=878477 RepID=A0A812KC42_9DINO|nr:unnamed protein product [Symbiodinium natans]
MSLTIGMMDSIVRPSLDPNSQRCRDNMRISIPEDAQDAYPPESVQIRNTFIHVATPNHEVEDASKHVFSCPASTIGWIQKLFEEDDAAELQPISTKQSSRPVICLEDALFDAVAHTPYAYDASHGPFSHGREELTELGARGLPAHLPSGGNPMHSSTGLPSIGSASHYTGECRPCAFLHAKGCVNGTSCSFCHLCDKGEKKRRQKAKKAMFQGLQGGA